MTSYETAKKYVDIAAQQNISSSLSADLAQLAQVHALLAIADAIRESKQA